MWDFDHVAQAVAAALEGIPQPTDTWNAGSTWNQGETWNEALAHPTVSVFAVSPASFNPPAYIVGRPETVELDVPAFTVDQINLAVLCFVGLGQDTALGELLRSARDAIRKDRSLGGRVQTARTIRFRNWAIMNISGAEFLKAELLLEVWA